MAFNRGGRRRAGGRNIIIPKNALDGNGKVPVESWCGFVSRKKAAVPYREILRRASFLVETPWLLSAPAVPWDRQPEIQRLVLVPGTGSECFGARGGEKAHLSQPRAHREADLGSGPQQKSLSGQIEVTGLTFI